MPLLIAKPINDMESINKKIAFDLFRKWTKNAVVDYPNNDFTIIDETNLVNDLKDTLKSSLRSLVKEEKSEKRKILGYDFGFIIGFIQGYLNKYWFNEYIINTKKYIPIMVVLIFDSSYIIPSKTEIFGILTQYHLKIFFHCRTIFLMEL